MIMNAAPCMQRVRNPVGLSRLMVVALAGANDEPDATDDSAAFSTGNAPPYDRASAPSDIPSMPALDADDTGRRSRAV